MTDVAPSGSNTGDRFYNPSFRPIFPGGEDTGIPAHMGSVKKLHSKTGYNLAVSLVDDKYKVIGTTDGNADGDDVLQLSSEEVGEVRIFGMKSRHYVAMDEDGKVYAEADNSAEATIFFEDLYNGWTIYRSKLNADKGWYLGIKKSAKAKRGHRTALGQNATLFIPRPTEQ